MLLLQQLPARQPPLQHTSPVGQSFCVWQAEHEWFTHGALPGHSVVVPLSQHEPVTQAPEQHSAPEPHCASWVQVTHWLFAQIPPVAAQSVLLQQEPARHWPPQHTSPLPHWALLVQVWQEP